MGFAGDRTISVYFLIFHQGGLVRTPGDSPSRIVHESKKFWREAGPAVWHNRGGGHCRKQHDMLGGSDFDTRIAELAKLGLDTEFAQCQIQVSRKEWEGVRRKYWHGRDTYYLPIATWNKDALAQGDADVVGSNDASKDCNETVTKKLKT